MSQQTPDSQVRADNNVAGEGLHPPETLKPNFGEMPEFLKQKAQWVLWKLDLRDGKWTKPPFSISGRHARTNDPATWSSFEEAKKVALANPDYAGVGFCLSDADGLTGIDLDHCVDPETLEFTKPEAAEIVARFKGTRIERSPSGDGLRIWAKGKAKRSGKARQQSWIEVYTSPSSRYLTVTGHRWEGSAEEIMAQQAELDWLHETYMDRSRQEQNQEKRNSSTTALTDRELIEKIRSSRQGAAFARLYGGEAGEDHSVADFRLCSILAFWCGHDPERIDRIFRGSGLIRAKWDEVHSSEGLTYGQVTIAKAIEGCDTVYSARNSESERVTGGNDAERESRHSQHTRQSSDAEEPIPLRADLAPAKAYPVDTLGEILGDAVNALHEVVKAPLALCAQSVLAAASFAAQGHFDVMLPWRERKPLSLFLLTGGVSGERKSTLDNVVFGAAKTQEREDMERYQGDQEEYALRLAAYQHAVDAAKKAATSGGKGGTTAEDVLRAVTAVGEAPPEPRLPLRFVTEPTVEGLFKLLSAGKPSVALFSDEAGLLIGGHALNSDNALKTLSRWSKMWDGAPFDRVRAKDGSSVLYGRRMALHQLAQPEVLAQLLSDHYANCQGFLSRCLVAWPESAIGERIETGSEFQWAGSRSAVLRLYAVLKRLMEAEPRTRKNPQELDPIPLTLTDEAIRLCVDAHNQFEMLMRDGGPLHELRDRGSKAMEIVCRISGVFTVMEHGLAARHIERRAIEQALKLMQWYLDEMLRIQGALAVPQSVRDAESLSAWLRNSGHRVFTLRMILQRGPNPLRHKPRAQAAVKELVENGYIVEQPTGSLVDGKKTRQSWEVKHYVV